MLAVKSINVMGILKSGVIRALSGETLIISH